MNADIDRSPQKTNLKSPAVRIQTPKQRKLDSPSRVKRMLSFAELDADFDDENLNAGKADDADILESPTETARPAKSKGLTQQRPKKRMGLMEEEEEEDEEEEIPSGERSALDYGGDYGGDFGFPDEPFQQDEEEEEEDLPLEEDDNLEDMEEEQEDEVQDEEDQNEEDDISGQQETPPPVKRSKGRTKVSEKATKKPAGRQRTKSSSSQPVPKRARTTSAAPRSPKIIQRKVIPHPADISTMDGDGISTAMCLN